MKLLCYMCYRCASHDFCLMEHWTLVTGALESIVGPKIAGPLVLANSSSWISFEGQACAHAHCCPYCSSSSPHSGLGRGKGRAAARPLHQQDDQKRQAFQAGEGAEGQMRWDWKKRRRLDPSFVPSRTSWNISCCCFLGGGGVRLCVIEWWNWWFFTIFGKSGFCSDSSGQNGQLGVSSCVFQKDIYVVRVVSSETASAVICCLVQSLKGFIKFANVGQYLMI